MSKQSDAKDRQGYVEKAITATCANCAHYSRNVEMLPGYFDWSGPRRKETNRRCELGGFAVRPSASCNSYERKA